MTYEPLERAKVLTELRERFGEPSTWNTAEVRHWLRHRFEMGHRDDRARTQAAIAREPGEDDE